MMMTEGDSVTDGQITGRRVRFGAEIETSSNKSLPKKEVVTDTFFVRSEYEKAARERRSGGKSSGIVLSGSSTSSGRKTETSSNRSTNSTSTNSTSISGSSSSSSSSSTRSGSISEGGFIDGDEDSSLVFDTSKEACTPITRQVQYRNPAERDKAILAPASSIARPNYEDILRRVSVVIHQHISKCELTVSRMTPETAEIGLFRASKIEVFSEEHYTQPQYVYHFVRAPISRLGFLYGIRKVTKEPSSPSLSEVHTFLRDLFVNAQLSAECSIVCLIYVERLMEHAHVPLIAKTWRPCLLCGLLLASKVWQDLSSWNSEIAQIYPQYSLQAINKLERIFCQEIKWDLYISSSAYAKYYFALRSLTEKKDFRRNYNIMMINAPNAQQVAERSEGMKEEYLATVLSKSL